MKNSIIKRKKDTKYTLNRDLLVEDNDYKKLINEYKKKFNK